MVDNEPKKYAALRIYFFAIALLNPIMIFTTGITEFGNFRLFAFSVIFFLVVVFIIYSALYSFISKVNGHSPNYPSSDTSAATLYLIFFTCTVLVSGFNFVFTTSESIESEVMEVYRGRFPFSCGGDYIELENSEKYCAVDLEPKAKKGQIWHIAFRQGPLGPSYTDAENSYQIVD